MSTRLLFKRGEFYNTPSMKYKGVIKTLPQFFELENRLNEHIRWGLYFLCHWIFKTEVDISLHF